MGKEDNKSVEAQLLSKVVENTEKTAGAVAELSKQFELHVQKMDFELKEISRTNEIQNSILDEHHKRSDRLEEQNELTRLKLRAEIFGEGMPNPDKRKTTIVGRIESLEAPKKAAKWVYALVMAGLALAAAVLKVLGVL